MSSGSWCAKPRARNVRPRMVMTTRFRTNKIGLFCCVAFAAVSTTNAQLEPEPRQLIPIGVNQRVCNDCPGIRYLFYCRTGMLLVASAGAWLFSQRRRRPSSSAAAVPLLDAINQCGCSHDLEVPALALTARDRVETFREPEIF